LVEIRSLTSKIRGQKKEERRKRRRNTAVKYKPFNITMLCGLKKQLR